MDDVLKMTANVFDFYNRFSARVIMSKSMFGNCVGNPHETHAGIGKFIVFCMSYYKRMTW